MNATYSPEDNKLRLYPDGRLDTQTYTKVKAAGFIWAPKQELFVAPMWTPGREDLLIDLCGEVGDEDTSLVDRAEQRAERFEDYSESRARDAHQAHAAVSSIADGIPLGQPILIGHHSERHARRDAEKIENGMRRAVKMWETAQYWQSRAKGAIRAAKYKELPAVRARRIKGLEADVRRYTRTIEECEACIENWGIVLRQPEEARMRHALHVANYSKSTPWGTWGDLRDGKITPEQAAEGARATCERNIADARRWLAHLGNRLEYEKAMLEEAGAADLLKPKPRPTQLPLLNYRAPDGKLTIPNKWNRGEFITMAQVEMTAAQYADIYRDYKGTEAIGNSHRVRVAIVKHQRVTVFLTDSKVHPIPGDVEPKPEPEPEIKVREYVPYTPPEPTVFDAMKDSLRAGVQVVAAPQLFPTPPELARRMADEAGILAGRRVLEPSAGTGNLVRAIFNNASGADCVRVVAVEQNSGLVQALMQQREKTVYANDGNFVIRHADFLTCNGDLGTFDAVLMNPPFENAADIHHIQHAMKFLKPGGVLVAICANGPRQNERLKPLMDSWEVLPSGTFAGTGVTAALMTWRAR